MYITYQKPIPATSNLISQPLIVAAGSLVLLRILGVEINEPAYVFLSIAAADYIYVKKQWSDIPYI
jgi:hypothetical protein